MKLVKKLLLLLCVAMTLSGCGSKHDKNLVGKWEITLYMLDVPFTYVYEYKSDGTWGRYPAGDEFKELCTWTSNGSKYDLDCGDKGEATYDYKIEGDTLTITYPNGSVEKLKKVK